MPTTRPAYARKMAWLMPRMAKAVPYLGYVVVAGTRPHEHASAAPAAPRSDHG